MPTHLDLSTLTFRGHPRSKIISLFESPYMTSYSTSNHTFSLSRTVLEIFDFKVFRVDLDFEPLGVTWIQKYFHHLKAHIWLHLITLSLYLVPFSRYSTSKVSGFDLDLSPLGVAWLQKIFPPFESPYMSSYLTSIDTFSLSRTVFEIFDFKVFRVWPWSLTFGGHPRSKIFSVIESPYIISYLTSIDTVSLSRRYRFSDIRLRSTEYN